LLDGLPQARRCVGPWTEVVEEVRNFYSNVIPRSGAAAGEQILATLGMTGEQIPRCARDGRRADPSLRSG
jgi:hypothetical protein